MAHYEIEIKSLLGEKEHAEALKARMCTLDPATVCITTSRQLNHYFEGGDVSVLYEVVGPLFTAEQRERLARIITEGADFSIRTRQKDEEVLLVVKASLDGGTSANTISRLEFEEPVDCTLEELDALLLEAGFTYQAKWSREREEYVCLGTTVCIDKNAGYGHLAEFEKVIPHGESVEGARAELEALMAELGVVELPQERLARMFAYYNQNWSEYYGTDKTFHIE